MKRKGLNEVAVAHPRRGGGEHAVSETTQLKELDLGGAAAEAVDAVREVEVEGEIQRLGLLALPVAHHNHRGLRHANAHAHRGDLLSSRLVRRRPRGCILRRHRALRRARGRRGRSVGLRADLRIAKELAADAEANVWICEAGERHHHIVGAQPEVVHRCVDGHRAPDDGTVAAAKAPRRVGEEHRETGGV